MNSSYTSKSVWAAIAGAVAVIAVVEGVSHHTFKSKDAGQTIPASSRKEMIRDCLLEDNFMGMKKEGADVRKIRISPDITMPAFRARLVDPDGIRSNIAAGGWAKQSESEDQSAQAAYEACNNYAHGRLTVQQTQAELRRLGMHSGVNKFPAPERAPQL